MGKLSTFPGVFGRLSTLPGLGVPGRLSTFIGVGLLELVGVELLLLLFPLLPLLFLVVVVVVVGVVVVVLDMMFLAVDVGIRVGVCLTVGGGKFEAGVDL